MRQKLGFAIAVVLLLSSGAWAASAERGAESQPPFLTDAPSGTASVQPLFLSAPPVDCSEFDHFDCFYYWDCESNCCVAPDTPTGQICPFACFY